jgi:S-adenosylmethionine:tRNA ribosyltransferase-isomerase
MHVSEFDYHLPENLIAQTPTPQRDESRMLVLERKTGHYRDAVFRQLPEELAPGSVLVINNTRVFPARLIGNRKAHQGKIELLLLRQIETTTWEALIRPGRAARLGAELQFGEGMLDAAIVEKTADGKVLVEFRCDKDQFNAIIDQIGLTPLPPYIKRPDASLSKRDAITYQTVFAKHRGAVAAPTAGLHFTERVLTELKVRGIDVVEITLHVGYGTFTPIRAEEVSEHKMDAEQYVILESTASAINRARIEQRPVVAVGTTVVRALESAATEEGLIQPANGWTDLFIYPGYTFKVVDAMVTNFHLPRSTLLMLVCAFGGKENTLRAYQHAIAENYRFYSYGDCMLIY